jgi:hypothetical protein
MTTETSSSTALVPYTGGLHPLHSAISQVNARQEARMQEIMARSLKSHFADFNAFHSFGKGDIVVLVGTSTAGKSSIIRGLRKLEPDRLEDGGDIRCDHEWAKGLAKAFPREFKIAAQALNFAEIVHAVHCGSRQWKKGVPKQIKEAAEEAIQTIKKALDEAQSSKEEAVDLPPFEEVIHNMYDTAISASLQGRKIIFDLLHAEEFAQHMLMRNFHAPMRVVLTYCPFSTLSARMEKRNRDAVESGDLENQRVGTFPLMQFGQLYTQVENGEIPLETVTRSQVIKIFDENFDLRTEQAKLKGDPLPSDEEIQEDKEQQRQDLLKMLGFKNMSVSKVDIGPKHRRLYDMIVDTRNSSAEIAKMLHEGTYK